MAAVILASNDSYHFSGSHNDLVFLRQVRVEDIDGAPQHRLRRNGATLFRRRDSRKLDAPN